MLRARVSPGGQDPATYEWAHDRWKVAPTDKELSGFIRLNQALKGGITHGALLAGCFPQSVLCERYWSHWRFGPAQNIVLQAHLVGRELKHGLTPHPSLNPIHLATYSSISACPLCEALLAKVFVFLLVYTRSASALGSALGGLRGV